MTVVIDTNVWVTFALNNQLEFVSNLKLNNVNIATCKELLDELIDVVSRPKFEKRFTEQFINELSGFHQVLTNHFDLPEIEPVVADQKDDYLFALCKISNADYLVTGDKLLLAVGKYLDTSVITLADLKNQYSF